MLESAVRVAQEHAQHPPPSRSVDLARPAAARSAMNALRTAGNTSSSPAPILARYFDADFSLKTIGDFVGHRSAKSTQIYAKVAVEPLREVALGDGEEVLA